MEAKEMPCRIVRRLAVDEAAYLAGLIDGEGTVTMSRLHARDRRQLIVSISSTEPGILGWVRQTVGAGKVTRKRVASVRHAPGLTFTAANRQALDLLGQTAMYLRSYKRMRAELALAKYVATTPRNGRYSPETARLRDEFESTILALHPAERRVRPELRRPATVAQGAMLV